MSRKIIERHAQAIVLHDGAEGFLQVLGAGVVGAVRGLYIVANLDVFGADGRAQENEIVVVIVPQQDGSHHRVEEGFGQLGLEMIHQHADIKQLGLAPNLHRHAADLKLLRQFVFALLHAQIVKRDALTLPLLLAVPILRLEAVLGLGRFGAKELVVPIKPLHDELGNLMRLRGGGSLREMMGHKDGQK